MCTLPIHFYGRNLVYFYSYFSNHLSYEGDFYAKLTRKDMNGREGTAPPFYWPSIIMMRGQVVIVSCSSSTIAHVYAHTQAAILKFEV